MAYSYKTVNNFIHSHRDIYQNFFSPKTIPVYHCCTGHLGTLTWGQVAEHGLQNLYKNSLENAICYPHLQFTESR